MVAHMLTRSTAAGSSNRVAFSTADPAVPSKMNPNTRFWRSRIQDIPDHIQLHSWVSIQLHCSGWAVWTVSRVGSMRVSPPAVRRMTEIGDDGFRQFVGGSASDVPGDCSPRRTVVTGM